MNHIVNQTEYKVLWDRLDKIRDLIGLVQDDCSKWNLNYNFQEFNENVEEMISDIDQVVQESWIGGEE